MYYRVTSAKENFWATARTKGGAEELCLRWEARGYGRCTYELVSPEMDAAARNIAFALAVVGAWIDGYNRAMKRYR